MIDLAQTYEQAGLYLADGELEWTPESRQYLTEFKLHMRLH